MDCLNLNNCPFFIIIEEKFKFCERGIFLGLMERKIAPPVSDNFSEQPDTDRTGMKIPASGFRRLTSEYLWLS